MDQDTDVLLVLLETSLPPQLSVPKEELLEALISSHGDVELAAQILSRALPGKITASPARKPNSKRKPEARLGDWLRNTKRRLLPGDVRRENDASEGLAPDSLERPLESSTVPEMSAVRQDPTSLPSSSAHSSPLAMILKDKSSKKTRSRQGLPVLLLITPEAVANHTPTTLHTSILPADLACKLYYEMLDQSQSWTKNKWYLNDRLVESPHTTAFYARTVEDSQSESMEEATTYWYNGLRKGPPRVFSPLLEEALQHVEKVVRHEMATRKRFPLEWAGGDWSANVCAANCYRGSKEGVGAHSDQLTYLGPYPTIASISLGTSRIFRLREVIPMAEKDVRQAQTFDIPLPHNSLLIMHPPTQERFKHSIPTVKSIDTFKPAFPRNPNEEISSHTERINITFRFYRPDYGPLTIPKCQCEGGGKLSAILKANMKRRLGSEQADFFWQCNGGAQREGRSCKMWVPMDIQGRGPFVGK